MGQIFIRIVSEGRFVQVGGQACRYKARRAWKELLCLVCASKAAVRKKCQLWVRSELHGCKRKREKEVVFFLLARRERSQIRVLCPPVPALWQETWFSLPTESARDDQKLRLCAKLALHFNEELLAWSIMRAEQVRWKLGVPQQQNHGAFVSLPGQSQAGRWDALAPALPAGNGEKM